MNPHPARRTSVVAAILVGVGALLSSFITYLPLLWGLPNVPRVFVLQDPLGFALRPNAQPMALVAMFVALLVLTGLTWIFVRAVARAALPGRAAAVFFGTWGAVIVAAAIAGAARAPLVVIALRLPTEQAEYAMTQYYQIATAGVSWGLTWGWLAALVVALIHRATPAPTELDRTSQVSATGQAATGPYAYPPQAVPAAPTSGMYPPQPPHAG